MEQEIANLKRTMSHQRGVNETGRPRQSGPDTPDQGDNTTNEPEEARQTYRRPGAIGYNSHSHNSRFAGNITYSAHRGQASRNRNTTASTRQSQQQSADGGSTGRDNTGRNTRANIGQEKCLLIHDGTFNDFDKARFTKRYEVETVKCPTIGKATTDTTILGKIESYKPGLIIIHLGYADIHEGRESEEVIGECKALIRSACKKGKTCFSLPLVPQNTEHAEFRDKLQRFSDTMSDYITNYRRTKDGGDFQVFTSHPGPLNTHVKIQNELPEAKITTAYGKVLLWIKFRDSLDRMTGRLLPRRRANDNSTNNNHES